MSTKQPQSVLLLRDAVNFYHAHGFLTPGQLDILQQFLDQIAELMSNEH